MIRETLLIFVGSLGFVTPFLTNLANNQQNSNDMQKRTYSICNTEDCKEVADKIEAAMNKSLNPCEDFYGYVCGSWSSFCPVSLFEDHCSWDTINQKEIDTIVRYVLNLSPRSFDSVPLTIEKQWYRACVDRENILLDEYVPIKKVIEKIGGWPIAMDSNIIWNKTDFSWQKVANYYARLFGTHILFTILYTYDDNAKENILWLTPSVDNLLPFRWKKNNDTKYDDLEKEKLFFSIVKHYAESIGSNAENIASEILKVQQFKHEITDYLQLVGNMKRTTIHGLQTFYGKRLSGNSTSNKVHWLKTIRDVVNDSDDLSIKGSTKIIIFKVQYFQKLFDLLEKTSEKTVVNYIHWKFFKDSLMYLDNVLSSEEKMGREDSCIYQMAEFGLHNGISQTFIKNYFPEGLKDSAKQMAEEIRNEMKLEISSSSWMDNEAKTLAKLKLKAMKFDIGYPDEYENEYIFNQKYNGIKVGTDYFKNVVNLRKFKKDNLWKWYKLGKKNKRFDMLLTESNAIYDHFYNKMTIPAAQLFLPQFRSTLPEAVRYGSIGTIIGHEIGHGFDERGIHHYNESGDMFPLWSEPMTQKYQETVKCFVDQYNNYGVNGTFTLSDNIADSAGLYSSFEVYKEKKKEGNIWDVRLPKLENLSGEQLFFVTFANAYCDNVKPEIRAEWMREDRHVVEPYRINGAVSNMKEFARAFGCSRNSPMNPDKKCSLWN